MKDFRPETTKVKKGSWTVFLDLCKGCGLCLVKCPKKALCFGKKQGVYSTPAPAVDPEKCELCGICEMLCPDSAIRQEK